MSEMQHYKWQLTIKKSLFIIRYAYSQYFPPLRHEIFNHLLLSVFVDNHLNCNVIKIGAI